MRTKFVVLANGILTTPKLARIDGMQSFQVIRSIRLVGITTSI